MIMQAKWPAKLSKFGAAGILGIGIAGLSFGPAFAQDRGERKELPKEERGNRDRGEKERGDRREGERREVPKENIEEARKLFDEARHDLQKAMERMRDAEAKLAKLEGRPPAGGFGGAGGGGGDARGGSGGPGV